MEKPFHVGIEFNVDDIGRSDGWMVEFVVRWYGEPTSRCEESGLWDGIASQNVLPTAEDLLSECFQVGAKENGVECDMLTCGGTSASSR